PVAKLGGTMTCSMPARTKTPSSTSSRSAAPRRGPRRNRWEREDSARPTPRCPMNTRSSTARVGSGGNGLQKADEGPARAVVPRDARSLRLHDEILVRGVLPSAVPHAEVDRPELQRRPGEEITGPRARASGPEQGRQAGAAV